MGLEEICSARLDRLDVLIVAFLFAGGSPCDHPCEETDCPNRLSEQQAPHVFHVVTLLAFLAAVILARWTFWPVS